MHATQGWRAVRAQYVIQFNTASCVAKRESSYTLFQRHRRAAIYCYGEATDTGNHKRV